MNTLSLKRHYKFLITFFLFLCVCIVFGSTRIISYNFGEYTTETDVEVVNIENDTDIFDENLVHSVDLDITAQDYENLILYYTQNSEKEYLQTNITIDGVFIENVGLKLKGNQVILNPLNDINLDEVDFSFTVKFDKYISGQRYQGLSEISLISGDILSLKGEYIAGEVFSEYDIISPDMAFTSLTNSDVLSGIYLLKEPVNEEFLSENYSDDNGLLYKAENSLSFSYLGEDPVHYTDLFTQKTLVNNYDLKKLIEVLEFVSESGTTSFVDDFSKYIDIENYTKFLAINDILYGENDSMSLLNSYYIYYDLDTQTIQFIPWDSEYVSEIEETSIYEILEKVFSKQEIANITRKDIRGIIDNFTDRGTPEWEQKYVNDLEDNFLDNEGFKSLYEAVKLEVEIDLDETEFIETLESQLEALFINY